ncbi:hypothetical protein N752_29680 [Desulforamulus aquiferis]|nr:hypothetical protein [Desulforamulus aquiferis]RYD01475.1 hypothetical protein N752_29680 [Desulforamulus aquiferis]
MLLKKCMSLFKCILSILLSLTIFIHPATAANFSYPPLEEIILVETNSNGNIVAIDRRGKVAEYDYMNWKVINIPSSISLNFQLITYDGPSRRLLAGNTNRIYSIDSNTWSSFTAYPSGRNHYFIRGSDIHVLTHDATSSSSGTARIYKLVGGTWELVVQGPTNGVSATNNTMRFDYERITDKVAIYYSPTTINSNYAYMYDFNSKTWSSGSASSNRLICIY